MPVDAHRARQRLSQAGPASGAAGLCALYMPLHCQQPRHLQAHTDGVNCEANITIPSCVTFDSRQTAGNTKCIADAVHMKAP